MNTLQCRSPKGEHDSSAVNLFSRNRSQMFNSTSRYLVYCTINRGIKRVTIIPRYPRLYSCRNIGPREHRRSGRDHCRLPLFAHCAIAV